jgi:hypothetical protein
VKLRPDQKFVYLRNWDDEKTRLAGVAKLRQALVKIARAAKPETDAALPKPNPGAGRAEGGTTGVTCRVQFAVRNGSRNLTPHLCRPRN